MAVTQESTRQELREDVGHLLGVFQTVTGAASGSTTTLLVDSAPNATADDFNGRFLQFTSGANNDGLTRQVTDSSVSSNRVTLTFFPAVTDATATNDTAELWEQAYDPARIHNLFNQAIDSVTGQIFDPVEDISLHTGASFRFDIPTAFEVLYDVYMRTGTRSRQVMPSGVVWDESVDTDFTVALDTEDLLFGRQSTRFTVGSSVSAGDIVSDDIASTDLSGFTHIEFPIKVRDAVVADDLRLRLSASTNGSATTEEITIPAISAITDTWVRVAMTAPSAATAIISVALEYNANQGDNIIWLGEVRATRNNGDVWTLFPRNRWEIDKEARDLVFTGYEGGYIDNSYAPPSPYGGISPDYMLMKLKGGDNPAALTTDASVTEIPEAYIVNYVAGYLQHRVIKGESPEQARVRLSQASVYLGMAERAKRGFPILKNARFTV